MSACTAMHYRLAFDYCPNTKGWVGLAITYDPVSDETSIVFTTRSYVLYEAAHEELINWVSSDGDFSKALLNGIN